MEEKNRYYVVTKKAVPEVLLKVVEAKRLLEGTQLTIQEIVSHIGYLDTSSFIRKFKRETGETPGEYRGNRRRPEENRS